MKLQGFLGTENKYDVKAIAADPELARQTQIRLIDLGLLAPPADGVFGPLSTAALKRFQDLMNCDEPDYLGAKTAKNLIQTKRQDLPAPTPILNVLKDTLFKAKPIPSSELSEAEKQEIKAGSIFELVSFEKVRNHVRVTLRKDSFKNSQVWYLFGQHIEILEAGILVYPKPKPPSVQLDVAYKSQLDNYYNPTGSCNVTSIAMCLQYLGARRRSNIGQFEDELYEYALDQGLSRHDPYDLARIVRDYGYKDTFKENATVEEVQDWLADGNPAVAHGYFTSFGHIIVLVGYTETGFYVHDPYGEWFPTGYDTYASGAYLHYSERLIRRVCMPDGSFLVHFISK